MKNETVEDDLKPEYDLTTMRIRRVGAGRKYFQDEDMLDEYKFDYSKAKPNRFAEKRKETDEK